MGLQTSFHAPSGGDFLGWRKSRVGHTEIVYEDRLSHRMVWRVEGDEPSEDGIVAALSAAVASARVLPSLYDELKKRAIAIERIIG
ncbi:MAG: hypothetical protein A3D16_22880 [Rhodobacterales bacterium RIFCSPHIGHO2_02_FULL_62_130]|jgi:hypothetical protein|nr:MAG: hypothetical protein A3D16_22880 [Rhodobacterales bacterium RIFCSPHIGHO2_02_FULL_62_130]OHC54369.1 MAG: hypothetical protein A3E48_19620 [Rhodobacterales bacterium RIFCSPHIGHO2_12_FULL_62_75]HCY98465.1 hypothetical protein [Rhodobacter sp.]